MNMGGDVEAWIAHRDPNNHKIYYFNEATQQTTWERPEGFKDGWVRRVDQASGQRYYHNNSTGEHQWDHPGAGLLSDDDDEAEIAGGGGDGEVRG